MFNRIADKQPAAWSKANKTSTNANHQISLDSLPDWIGRAEKLVSKHPGAALVAAFLTGATIAWWLKRK